MSTQETYRTYRILGHSKRSARRQALVDSVIDDERDRLERGMTTYDRGQVRQAIVHGRQDIVLLIAQLEEVAGSLRSIRRWLIAAVALLAAFLWLR